MAADERARRAARQLEITGWNSFDETAEIIAAEYEPLRDCLRELVDALKRLHGVSKHLFPEPETDVELERQYHARMNAAETALARAEKLLKEG